jgi:hypothetical protein
MTRTLQISQINPGGFTTTTMGSTVMTFTDGVEEVTKLVLAASVGFLVQRLRFAGHIARIAVLEGDVAMLKDASLKAATKADLQKEIQSLTTEMNLKMDGITREVGHTNEAIQRTNGLLDRLLARDR